jgi:thiol-disulfide isomerase/thioredoxin
MKPKRLFPSALIACLLAAPLLAACTSVPETPFENWVDIKMTDVNTGDPFAVSDFSGKVILLGTMAEWCPNCLVQQAYIHKMYAQLGRPEDLILISLDVDAKEDEVSLRKFTEEYGFDWRFAVSPLMVSRALGNLYSVQYLNPPLDPMMIIDRQGNVHHLPYGIKDPDTLQKALEPFLAT